MVEFVFFRQLYPAEHQRQSELLLQQCMMGQPFDNTVATTDEADSAEQAVCLAEALLERSLHQTTKAEAAQMARVAGMIGSPKAKNFSLLMTDRIDRCESGPRTARMWRGLLERCGGGDGFPVIDRFLLRLGALGSRVLPKLVVGAVRRRLRKESADVILAAEQAPLTRHLASQRAAGARVNLNQLGEAVLGEEEAEKRLGALLKLLENKDVDYISVKISAIFSQIHLTAWEHTITAIKDRLRPLYRAAMQRDKFVNLDMEEYRDLQLTVQAFSEVLEEPEFDGLPAGVVLQAYLPDSIGVQRELTTWARQRVERGGAPIKVRLVKGANLAMEKVEAELHGWRVAPHSSKADTDACFKNMLEFACQPENAEVVRMGVGSHNLFDVALALVLREQNGVEEFVEIEMLEGMAPAQARAVKEEAGGLLLYAPIVKQEDFSSALAYLIRRLDENTSPGNFLTSLFSLKPGSAVWKQERDGFLAAWAAREIANDKPNRQLSLTPGGNDRFDNCPDSDWTTPRRREQLAAAVACKERPPQSGEAEIEAALTLATEARKSWAVTPEKARAEILRTCAGQIAQTRFETIALLRDEGKKIPAEGDVEVSEAIDFASYYAEIGAAPDRLQAQPLGTVVVAPPWNFPFAIPGGGILAALMAGNTVIMKPAPESVRIGWWLVRQLWAAGVPRDALQFIACEDGAVGRRLIEDPRSSAVILTGAFETARRFQGWRPSLRLFAETSGKNSLVVSAMADRELAAKDLVRSAFGHSGQKCSAASLAILEAEVYEDKVFLRQLRDAAASLSVGAATQPESMVTPLIQAPGESLSRALTALEDGESWLLEPQQSEADPCLWSPGIKLGVRPGSWFHQTECFGPVLGLMRARDLDEASAIQNDVSFGLTAGLHSLDETEIETWKNRAEAGNLYINRGITGAIVRRQPFGGWKRSSIGPGSKAGGPNYVNLFRHISDGIPPELDEVRGSYRVAWAKHFAIDHDPSGLRCESNVFRYRPCRGVLLRLQKPDEHAEAMARAAADTAGVKLIISHATEESETELAGRLPNLAGQIEFLRTTGEPASDDLLRAVAEADLNWIDAPLVSDGRIELTRWVREQSVSHTLHRYGHLPGAD